MEHIECIKKWPAIYKVMAAVMDDVNIDEKRAVEVWSAEVVDLSKVRNNAAIHEDDVRLIVANLAMKLGVGKVTPVASASAPEPKSAPTKTGGPVPSGKSGPPPRASYAKKKPSQLVGDVVKVYEVEKDAKFGGGVRHMMDIVPDGQRHRVEGTIPSPNIGKVKAGDRVSLTAQVWMFDDRKGWFKYPKDLKVL